LGFLALLNATMWLWGEMEGLDSFLYLYGEILHPRQWNSVGFLYQPLLFVVVMEALSRMLVAALEQGSMTGFAMGPRESEAIVVNHLLFADTLIFCGAQEEQIRHLRCIFLCFEAALGLRINLGKS